jgi:ectoine hydroxylase-related dioxygenase (phytanoyl-CoA dioxygenase family)
MKVYQYDSAPTKAKKQFQSKGFFIEPKLFDDKSCAALIKEAYVISSQNKDLPPLVMPHRHSDLFLSFLKYKKLVNIMSSLLGSEISGLQSVFYFSKPGTIGFSQHQDNFFVEAKEGVFASVWCPLVDTSPKNGSIYIYPGSNKLGNLPVVSKDTQPLRGQDRNANNEYCVVPKTYYRVDIKMNKGSALFIHGNLVHGSNLNQSDACRYTLLNTYIKKGAKFRPGKSAQREEVNLKINPSILT